MTDQPQTLRESLESLENDYGMCAIVDRLGDLCARHQLRLEKDGNWDLSKVWSQAAYELYLIRFNLRKHLK